MKSTIIGMAVALGVALPSGPAAAWASANRFGGSTEHVPGATEHSNAFGGSSAHAYGEGTEHTNMYGGSSAHAWGGGSEHTNVYGGSTYGAYGAGAVHTTSYGATAYRPPAYPAAPVYAPYHPPVAVPYYSSGCYNCAGAAAAGAVVGMAAGAAVASANTAAANANAYSSGYAAGSVNTAAAYAVGVNYAALPPGAAAISRNGTTYYLLGNTWFLPAYGANGVYYRVVPTP